MSDWLAQSGEPVTLDLQVMNSSPTFGTELTKKSLFWISSIKIPSIYCHPYNAKPSKFYQYKVHKMIQ